MDINFTAGQKEIVKIFYCPGGLNYDNMNFASKFAMKMLIMGMKAKKNPSEDDLRIIRTLSQSYDSSDKKYVEVAFATSGTDGIARLKHEGEDFGLMPGEKYYLIETEAPANYIKVNTVWEVEVQTEIGKFTDLEDFHGNRVSEICVGSEKFNVSPVLV
jgi:hypothetical protein